MPDSGPVAAAAPPGQKCPLAFIVTRRAPLASVSTSDGGLAYQALR